ncbi:MAG: PorP/SprF family type IX secretion system membrane protein [Muribaculaceae bacterium]|nr:PorP/SprF family type IX secretion system membrane protein [Muribaculaceae bacterium]
MTRLRLLLISFLACIYSTGVAQNDPLLSHYFEVPAFYNPAATGLTDLVRIHGGSRPQWVGIDNAPMTFLGLADTPFKLGKHRFGAGVSINQQSMGLYRNLSAALQISYKIKLLGGVLSVGIQPGIISDTFKGSEVFIPDDDDYHDDTDPAIPRTDVSGTALDLAAGIWYTRRAFRAGLSVTHLNSPKVTFSGENGSSTGDAEVQNFEFGPARSIYFTAEGNIAIKNTLFEVIPSVLVMSDFTFTRAIATARLRYKKFISAGIGYRHDDAVSALLSVEYKGFYLGYSYDYPTTDISSASGGSHEIFAGYALKLDLSDKNRHKQKSIRIL